MTDHGTDLGEGVTAHLVERGGQVVAVHHDHPAASGDGALGGGRCHGFMPIRDRYDDARNRGPTWEIAAGDPDTSGLEGLTLTPSSLCRACGHHGWITDGRWVAA